MFKSKSTSTPHQQKTSTCRTWVKCVLTFADELVPKLTCFVSGMYTKRLGFCEVCNNTHRFFAPGTEPFSDGLVGAPLIVKLARSLSILFPDLVGSGQLRRKNHACTLGSISLPELSSCLLNFCHNESCLCWQKEMHTSGRHHDLPCANMHLKRQKPSHSTRPKKQKQARDHDINQPMYLQTFHHK